MTEQQPQLIMSCRVCKSTDKLQRCSKCKIAFYCSQTHQQSDWRSHKIECRKLSNNNSSSVLLETQQQTEQSRTKKNVWPNNSNSSNNSEKNDDDHDDDDGVKKCLDTTSNSGCNSNSSSNIENKKSSSTEEKKIGSTADKSLPNLPQHISKLKKTSEDERENQHQFRNLAENSMRISNDNILSPNMVPR